MVSTAPTANATADEGEPFVVNASAARLTAALRRQLAAGAAAGGPLVWSHGDSEAVFHADELRLSLRPGLVLVEVTLETDQTGRAALVVPFGVGRSASDATLQAVTEGVPRGDALLAARWGQIVQDELWEGLLNVGQQDVRARGDALVVGGLYTNGRTLSYVVTRPFSAVEVGDYFTEMLRENPGLDSAPLAPPELTHVNFGEEPRPAPHAHEDLWAKLRRLWALLCEIWHALLRKLFRRKGRPRS